MIKINNISIILNNKTRLEIPGLYEVPYGSQCFVEVNISCDDKNTYKLNIQLNGYTVPFKIKCKGENSKGKFGCKFLITKDIKISAYISDTDDKKIYDRTGDFKLITNITFRGIFRLLKNIIREVVL